ncbi:unnamed protein product, partial [Didymodactylos carnosus]
KLNTLAPVVDDLDKNVEYSQYDRYIDIPSRGKWKHTAVYLNDPNKMHDYINANLIKSSNLDIKYIATQAPLSNTIEEFWWMILQYKVTKIVMLTKFEERLDSERLINKCAHYFPMDKQEHKMYGSIDVEVLDVQIQSELEIRELCVTSALNVQHVTHYYFTAWPDFGILDKQKLIDLIQMVNKSVTKTINDSSTASSEKIAAPLVVHCSAGVGRTGTYIAVDTVMHLLDKISYDELANAKLDIMGIVYQLRLDRARMVQTKDQYLLIYRCVEEYLARTGRFDACKQIRNI